MKSYNGEYLNRVELEALGVSCSGKNVAVHRSCVIINPENLSFGDHVRVDAFCVLSATGRIQLGNCVHIGPHCSLMGGGGITMKDFSGLSHGARIFSAIDDVSGRAPVGPMVPREFRVINAAPVEINSHCMIGTGSVVFPGVT
ncbi:MAG: acyltransferase, partial [Chthoniobacterales bacterium]